MLLAAMTAAAVLTPVIAGTQTSSQSGATPLPACEWCGAPEAPPTLGPILIIPTTGEAGERLIIEGTVYRPDGTTPAGGVLLYAYHTNAGGVYAKRGDETGNGRRHGYLRGWLRTQADGRYRIETIRPGSYPTRSEPAHVHMTLQPPGEPERYIDDVVFEGDPLLTAEHRARLRQRGGTGIVRLARDADGVLRVTRNIYLGRQ
jgi:protocatechuate 3,4-dioxygenase beta subunit